MAVSIRRPGANDGDRFGGQAPQVGSPPVTGWGVDHGLSAVLGGNGAASARAKSGYRVAATSPQILRIGQPEDAAGSSGKVDAVGAV